MLALLIACAPCPEGTSEAPGGLGIGVSMRCFLDVYGEPDDIDYTVDDRGHYEVQSFDYDDPWFVVRTDLFGGDGYAEHISLSNI
ncbi:MAG: hypothetical protein GY913_33125 [Proteobacteria bacterium]|nr:hypothetical protein [Pseudomonadota bacterium]MCP4921768.1 hypothetical protein [Pseudomonadota bacterium]